MKPTPIDRRFKMIRILSLLAVIYATASDAAFADRAFRLQPKVGSQWKLQCISNFDASLNVLGANAKPYSECETVTATIIVERVNADGVTELLLCVDRVEVTQIMRQGGKEDTLVYDSSAPRPGDSSDRWEDLEARSAALVGNRTGLILKPNGDLAPRPAEGVEDGPTDTRKSSCPPSIALMYAYATTVDALVPICLPERAVAEGAAWYHDATRSEFTGDPAPARLTPSALLRITRKRPPNRAVSKYEGKHATEAGDVERVTMVFSGACGQLSGTKVDGKVEGEALFDPGTGDLLTASWSIEATTKQLKLLGAAAVTVATGTRVTLAPANVESVVPARRSEPGVGADSR